MNLSRMTPDRKTGVPIYLQLATQLRRSIASGELDVGAALPSERLLSERTGASRVTIRKAIEQLVQEGLLARRHGSGTYVSGRIEQAGEALTSFTADAKRRGDAPGSVWIFRSVSLPTADEADILDLPPGQSVARLGRIRLIGEEPLAIEHAIVPDRLLPPIDAIGDSLYAALDIKRCRPVRGQQRLRASVATPIEAGLLSIAEGCGVLRIERRTFLADGTPVELTRSTYRGDRYEFVTELSNIDAE